MGTKKGTKVFLRKKKISGGRFSLYLDYYPAIIHPETGKETRREFLGLYIDERPANPLNKHVKSETLMLGESIRAKRQLEIQAGNFGFMVKQPEPQPEIDFLNYFRQVVNTKTGNTYKVYHSVLQHLTTFADGSLSISALTISFCESFREYLLNLKSKNSISGEAIAKSSVKSYWTVYTAVLNKAYREELISIRISDKIQAIRTPESHREYLSQSELNTLAKTPCKYPVIKRAALFSALSGLRISDIHALTWDCVKHDEQGNYYLKFTQKKTKAAEVLPISEQAASLMGERGEPGQRVFDGLNYSSQFTLRLRNWVLSSGITKDISFHSFRHTYATLQLTNGTDIYTVSKLLGHRSLKTTQIYTKVIDEAKRAAANNVHIDF